MSAAYLVLFHDLRLVLEGALVTLVIVQRRTITELKVTNEGLLSELVRLKAYIVDLISDRDMAIHAYRKMREAAKSYKATADVVTAICKKVARQLPAAMAGLKRALNQASQHPAHRHEELRPSAMHNPAANDALNAANDEAA